jgi:FlaA1/EpsC-like NDP-sugar epimerase
MKHLTKRPFIEQSLPLMLLDGIGVVASFLLALAFRFDGRVPGAALQALLVAVPVILPIYWVMNLLFGLYRRLWRYTSVQEVVTIIGSAATSTLVVLGLNLLWLAERPIPLSVVSLGGILSSGAFTTIRYRQRLLTGLMGYLQQFVGSPDRQRVLIVGAGEAGQLLAWQLKTYSDRHRYELVGFVDDDPKKLGMQVHGACVLGDCHAIPSLVTERGVSLIVIAIHRIPGPVLRDILSICLDTQVRVKILPDFLGRMDSLDGTLPLKDVIPEDLLGRQPCQVDEAVCREIIADKVVLVTGAAGSIGSELCRQIFNLSSRQLLMLDNNETGLHDLFISFERYTSEEADVQPVKIQRVVPIVGDITDQAKMEKVFATYHPRIVFHAAAHKHVPLMEQHPEEAVRVNVLGTRVVAQLAGRYGVDRFVLISTDKAVKPCSVMGATKRLCEMLIINGMQGSRGAGAQRTSGVAEEEGDGAGKGSTLNVQQKTLFTAVRFGNVLGSRGSVVPTFTRQIDRGGPVTVTHPEMTRFFMSLSEAVSLIIQAASLTEGGDIFMLDMGQEIRIEDLACKMIRLRGLRPGEDIPIVHTGVRPGEKLHEELLAPDEDRLPTIHPKIFRVRNNHHVDGEALSGRISHLIELACQQRSSEIMGALWSLVRADTIPANDQCLP